MIKINLLDSVTERKSGAVVAVDRKIGSPLSKFVVMSVAVALLLCAVVGWDVISTQMAKNKAEREIVEQKQIQTALAEVLKEQKELEQKISNIDARIDAIKKLRLIQAGPSQVLEDMVQRISSVSGIFLDKIEQTEEQLVITGNSPDDTAVIEFARSLEFSGSLFSNLSITTNRLEQRTKEASPNSTNPDEGLIHIVGFTITCSYTPDKANGPKDATTAENKKPAPAGAQPPQIAKN